MPTLSSNSSLLTEYLPRWTFAHRHSIVVDSGDIEAVYNIARDVNMGKSRFIAPLLKLRGLPSRRLNARAFTESMGWTDMAQIPGEEFLIGYWRSHRTEPVFSRAQFLTKTPGATQKVAFNFRFRRLGAQQVEINTETRVLCIGRWSTWTFRLYWLAIRPFSGLIRKEILKIIKHDAEALAHG